MIRVALLYPNTEGHRFDEDYYRSHHLPLVKKAYKPFGLKSVELDTALTTSGKYAAPYFAIGYMVFETTKQFMQAAEAEGAALMQDIANFTDIEPIIQISQLETI